MSWYDDLEAMAVDDAHTGRTRPVATCSASIAPCARISPQTPAVAHVTYMSTPPPGRIGFC